MNFTKFQLWLSILFVFCIYHLGAQKTEIESVRDVGRMLNSFAIDLLHRTAEQAGESTNIALSPYTVWSLLAIILEGARGVTAHELQKGLGITSTNRTLFQFGYKSLTKFLMQPAKSAQLDLSSAIFTTIQHDLNRTFQARVQDTYNVEVLPTDFNKLVEAENYINSYVTNATKGRTKDFVSIDDINQALILMVSTLYFKGEWKIPFNESYTTEKEFFNYKGDSTGRVMMMYQRGAYPYSYIQSMRAHAVELPYGDAKKFSMVVMLPRKGEKLTDFLDSLHKLGFSSILESLARSDPEDEDGVEVYLPRFSVNSDLNLNAVLSSMGISSMFNPQTADLLGMFPHYLSVTRVIQKAKIEVNEQGTVFESAAGAGLGYRIPPPKFMANRDFAYFVYEKETKSIIFAGTVTNPTTLSSVKK